jgi:hypothetical protein
MRRRIILAALVGAFVLVMTGWSGTTLAATPPSDPGDATLEFLDQTGLGGQTPSDSGNRLPVIIGGLIRAALGLLGIILVVLMLYGGFLWMTARGEATQVDKAKQTITRAVIGAIIIFSAYAITGFVIDAIVKAGN